MEYLAHEACGSRIANRKCATLLLYQIEEGIEDVHSQVEHLLVQKIGDLGKKIHLGRSRNDQVLVDLRLFFRDHIDNLNSKLLQLAELLLNKSEEHKKDLMPGYTHMQMAMVSSFGLWFGAYAESILEDIELFQNIRSQINKNPLGTAAGYGSSIPLDRQQTTQFLQFDDLCVNSMYAQIGRGKTELLVAQGMSQIALSLGKLAMDICHFSSQNFGFMKLSDEFTTGSSIMPHKKNPDVFELVRANCNLVSSVPQQVSSIIGNLTSGYHRDFQILKELLFPAIQRLNSIIDITAHALPALQIHPPDLKDPKYKYLFSVEKVNELVNNGIPFRDAYKKIGMQITEAALLIFL